MSTYSLNSNINSVDRSTSHHQYAYSHRYTENIILILSQIFSENNFDEYENIL